MQFTKFSDLSLGTQFISFNEDSKEPERFLVTENTNNGCNCVSMISGNFFTTEDDELVLQISDDIKYEFVNFERIQILTVFLAFNETDQKLDTYIKTADTQCINLRTKNSTSAHKRAEKVVPLGILTQYIRNLKS